MTYKRTKRLGEVTKNHNKIRVPLSKMERENLEKIYPYYGAQGIIDYVDNYLFNGTYLLIAEDGENLRTRKNNIASIAYGKFWVNNHAHILSSENFSDLLYIFYSINNMDIAPYLTGSVQPKLNMKNLEKLDITWPRKEIRYAIVNILSAFDDKIENNNAIIANIEEQAQAIFKSWFEDFEPFQDEEFVDSELGIIPSSWEVKEANNWFTINIGKTPPRKQTQWFSTNSKDVKWLSISDMKNTQTFVNKTSEYLTNEAIDKFNVKIVPTNSILLSFKLTVGRVAITRDELTTNEAIAHFHINQYAELYYLYLYLKTFNYQKLGNTSSIGNAVNSKIIKAMPILKPNEKVLRKFHAIIKPLFDMTYEKVKENEKLKQIRDTLLPKLMSGEIRVKETIEVE